ncbi:MULTISPECIES: ABC transporter substrate-binding protein [unclassified Sinorhizobium]|uniref:ABC transporter substrate-binding protein n=1 Tax=unclassified Sinorhizobium TaxID=2613772 RepID=UPI0035238B5D
MLEFISRSWRFSRRSLFVGVVSAALAGGAHAQSTIDAIASYTGPDRMEKLIAAAKQEGALQLYTVTPVEDVTVITKAFEAKYGIPVQIWRGSSEDVLRRAVTELKAGRHDVDVIETNGPELEALHREHLLEPIQSPLIPDIFPGAVPEHREWIGSRLNIITAAYNPDSVSEADLPKKWEDLLDPKWAGKLGIEAVAYDWLATAAKTFPSEQEGMDFFKKLMSANHPGLYNGHPLLTNDVASSEVPLALTVYLYKVAQMERDGAPIKRLSIGPAIARINGLGVARTAPHPNAAILYQDFTLTDGQKILADRQFTPTNIKIVPLPEGMEVRVINPDDALDNLAAWRDKFEHTFK